MELQLDIYAAPADMAAQYERIAHMMIREFLKRGVDPAHITGGRAWDAFVQLALLMAEKNEPERLEGMKAAFADREGIHALTFKNVWLSQGIQAALEGLKRNRGVYDI